METMSFRLSSVVLTTKQECYDLAAYLYTTAIDMNPSHPDAYLCYSNRSECMLRLFKYKEALKDAEEALRLMPGFISLYQLTCGGHDKSEKRRKLASEKFE